MPRINSNRVFRYLDLFRGLPRKEIWKFRCLQTMRFMPIQIHRLKTFGAQIRTRSGARNDPKQDSEIYSRNLGCIWLLLAVRCQGSPPCITECDATRIFAIVEDKHGALSNALRSLPGPGWKAKFGARIRCSNTWICSEAYFVRKYEKWSKNMCSDYAISISNINKRDYNRSETFGAQIRIRSGPEMAWNKTLWNIF